MIKRACAVLALLMVDAMRLPAADDPKPINSTTYQKLKTYLDSIPAIDTHDHLWPFDKLPGYVETENGKGMNLSSMWRNSYLTRIKGITPWKAGGKFDDWWKSAKND